MEGRVDVLPGGTPGSGFAAKGAGAGRPDLVEEALARARAVAALAHFRPGDAVTVAGRRCRVLGVRGPDGAGCGRVELEVLERGRVGYWFARQDKCLQLPSTPSSNQT